MKYAPSPAPPFTGFSVFSVHADSTPLIRYAFDDSAYYYSSSPLRLPVIGYGVSNVKFITSRCTGSLIDLVFAHGSGLVVGCGCSSAVCWRCGLILRVPLVAANAEVRAVMVQFFCALPLLAPLSMHLIAWFERRGIFMIGHWGFRSHASDIGECVQVCQACCVQVVKSFFYIARESNSPFAGQPIVHSASLQCILSSIGTSRQSTMRRV